MVGFELLDGVVVKDTDTDTVCDDVSGGTDSLSSFEGSSPAPSLRFEPASASSSFFTSEHSSSWMCRRSNESPTVSSAMVDANMVMVGK